MATAVGGSGDSIVEPIIVTEREISSSKMISFLTRDQKLFNIEEKAISKSVTVKRVLEDVGAGDSDDPIPLPAIDSSIFELIVQWCIKHIDDPVFIEPDEETIRKAKINEWDQEFLDVGVTRLFNIIQAANYLEMRHLLILGCKTVANMMKGHSKDPEYIRKLFGLPNDLKPEEVRMDMMWDEEEEDDKDAITL